MSLPSNFGGDKMVLRRSAFDFLLEKNLLIMGSSILFTEYEARAFISNIKIPMGQERQEDGLEIRFLRLKEQAEVEEEDWEDSEEDENSEFEIIRLFVHLNFTVAGYQREDDEDMIPLEGKLNVEKRMDALAFPVDRYDDRAHTPVKKRSRITAVKKSNMMESIAGTVLLKILSFSSSMRDIMPVTRVCKRWRHLIFDTKSGDQEIWKLLCQSYHPVLVKVKQDIPNTVTWKELFLERSKHMRALLRPRELEGTVPSHYEDVLDNGPYQPRGIQSHTFSVRLYSGNGITSLFGASVESLSNGVLKLNLDDDGALCLAKCQSMDVVANGSLRLYSGTVSRQTTQQIEFATFNRFDKFRAQGHLLPIRTCTTRDGIRNVGIPSVSPIFQVGASQLCLTISWQTETDERSLVSMSEEDLLVFIDKGLSPMQNEPESWSLAPSHSSPPLSSYTFMVDYLLNNDERYPCAHDVVSCLYEPQDIVEYYSVPWDPGRRLRFKFAANSHLLASSATEIVVYVVNKLTGMQAKIYQSEVDVPDFEYRREFRHLKHYQRFPDFSVLSFFSGRPATFGTAPSVSVRLFENYGEAEYDVTRPFYLEMFWMCNLGDWGTGSPFGEAELLRFFEKGLSWGNYVQGNHRNPSLRDM